MLGMEIHSNILFLFNVCVCSFLLPANFCVIYIVCYCVWTSLPGMSRALRSDRPAAGFFEEFDEDSSDGEGSEFDSLSGEDPADALDRCVHIDLM